MKKFCYINQYLTQWQTHSITSFVLKHYTNSYHALELHNKLFCYSPKITFVQVPTGNAELSKKQWIANITEIPIMQI